MNTMQFGWVKNRLPDLTQPVPPIYDPELTAQVVVKAGMAQSPRREYWVGAPTVAAIVGQKFIPGLLDRYLGRTGYKSQQLVGQPKGPNAPDNLYAYVPGTHSARGKFDDRMLRNSLDVSMSLNPGWFALGAGLLAVGGLALATRRRS